MFVRPCWRPRCEDEPYRLVADNVWALLVTNGEDGPLATNLPLMLDRARGKHGVLVGHIARANEHAKVLQDARGPSLAIFEGPWSYVTASWYPNRDMPSTYYYTAVHCYGGVRLQTEAALEASVGRLTRQMETPLKDGWKLSDVAHSEITRRLPSILGFELEIERIEGKFKLGQDEPRKDALAVSARLSGSSDPAHRALAEMIQEHNLDRAEG